MRNKRKFKEKGITLIALVITVIILLILAGVTISQLSGDNGLFEIAKRAKQNTIDAQVKENEILDDYLTLMGGEQLPENTPDTEAGTIVKNPEGWNTETVRYVSTQTGVEVVSGTKVATVYAVSVGNGETVPIPYEFYYVGGNKESGVVISDNKSDKDKYAGQDDVGIDLVGNQFVWIPCSSSEYKKTDWGQTSDRISAYWDTTTYKAELSQIEKYGGFYVARYESGLDTSKAHTETLVNNSNYHDSETAKPQSKAGLVPWTCVSWNTSKARSEEMYNTNYVSSGLITGTQWDVMINKIAEKENVSVTQPDWGNYNNVSIEYTGPIAMYSSANLYLGVFEGTGGTTSDTTDTAGILYTGASVDCMKYNLYDVAGNVWEWTEEASYYGGNSTVEYRVLRGGEGHNINSEYPVCYRLGGHEKTYTGVPLGFRVVLYIK